MYASSHAHACQKFIDSKAATSHLLNTAAACLMRDVVEYAKSSRAACKGCNEKIEKGNLRLGRVSKGEGTFDMTRWYHPVCYVDSGVASEGIDQLLGFSVIKEKDKNLLKELFITNVVENSPLEQGGELTSISKRTKHFGLYGSSSMSTGGIVNEVHQVQKFIAEESEVELYIKVNWEAKLVKFNSVKLSSTYKGARLPVGWTSFETVIIRQGENDVQPSAKIAAFDFDGCLANTDVRRHGPSAWKLMYPSVPSKLHAFHSQGFKLVIFTNESNIDRFINARQKAIDSKIGRIEGLLAAAGVPAQVFIACGKSDTMDPCRKPSPGMWHLMAHHLNGGISVDMASSFYVGDAAGRPGDHSAADIGFAKANGVTFVFPEDVFKPQN